MYPPQVWTESHQDSFGLCHCCHTFKEGRGNNTASACAMHRVPEGGALTGPPRPSVYCSVKCFGGQKPGAALKDVACDLLMHIRIERGRAGAWAESLWGHLMGGDSGQEGTWEPRHQGRIPADPLRGVNVMTCVPLWCFLSQQDHFIFQGGRTS